VVSLPGALPVATALAGGHGEYRADGYDLLIDAPLEVGPVARGEVRAAGGRIYRVAVDGAPAVPERLLRAIGALADAEAALAGPPPYGGYLLLIHLADGPARLAALEHAASASLVVPSRSLVDGAAYDELLYVIAHELFHAWNARRLRPAELVPYDLQRAQPARSLWITEGFTEYFAHRAMLRAGLWTRARYLDRVGEEAARAVEAARRGLSIEESAELAWSTPDEAGGDPDAYYAQGHLVALALDATLRATTGGTRSLADVLQDLLRAADRSGGVLAVDTEVVAKAVSALAPPLGAQLKQWARTRFDPAPLTAALKRVGLSLKVVEEPERTAAGFAADREGKALRVARVNPGGAAARAGLQPGDLIERLDGIEPRERWGDRIAHAAAGAAMPLEILRGGRRLHLWLVLEALRAVDCRLVEVDASAEVAQLRQAFLGP
jgi:predicted metalloprotease with PDZ domain